MSTSKMGSNTTTAAVITTWSKMRVSQGVVVWTCCPLWESTPVALPRLDTSSCGVCPPVHPATGLPHTPRCPQIPARPPPVHPCWPCSSGRHIPARPCDTVCRREDRTDSQALPSLWPVTPSAASEHSSEVRGSTSNLLVHRHLLRSP